MSRDKKGFYETYLYPLPPHTTHACTRTHTHAHICTRAHTHTARGLTDRQTDGTKYQAFLLFNEKQSFRKLGEIIYHQSRSGEIYVRRDALTVVYSSGKLLYSNIITYGGSGLRQLWRLVFADGSTLLGKGLVAFGLQNSAIVWIRGRPDELGNVVGEAHWHVCCLLE